MIKDAFQLLIRFVLWLINCVCVMKGNLLLTYCKDTSDSKIIALILELNRGKMQAAK